MTAEPTGPARRVRGPLLLISIFAIGLAAVLGAVRQVGAQDEPGALEALRTRVTENPGDADAHNDLGKALIEIEQYDEALEHFATAVRLDPDHADAKANRRLASVLAEDWDEEWDGDYGYGYGIPIIGSLLGGWGSGIGGLLVGAFIIWMLVEAIRRGEGIFWIWIILITGGIGAGIYFFMYYWPGSPMARALGGAAGGRRQLQALKSKAHTIDNAYHHARLGEAWMDRRKWDEARASFEASLEREPDNFEVRTHLGYALLKLGRAEEAWKRLEPSLAENPEAEYGHLLWESARCLVALGDEDRARELYARLLGRNTYAEASYEYSLLLIKAGDRERAAARLEKMINEYHHTPRYQQRIERRWVNKARRALRGLKKN